MLIKILMQAENKSINKFRVNLVFALDIQFEVSYRMWLIGIASEGVVC